MSEYYNQIISEFDKSYSLIIDDDGKVCYAYLMKNDNVIGDVWLYNQGKAPITNNWDSVTDAPFLNPVEFVSKINHLSPLKDSEKINIKWVITNSVLEQAEIFLNNFLIAIIKPNSKPGWSLSAGKDGPLAKVLDINDRRSL